MDTEGNLWASRPTNAAGGLDSVPEPPAPDSGFYFIGWFDSLDSRVEPTTVFTGNTTLSAKYSKLTIVFLNADGDTLQNSVAKYGSIPKYMGKTPTKASTTGYDYTFYGWNPNLATATEPATYTAVFDSSLKTFMVTFRNGFTTLQSTKVGYGATPAYNGNTPTKPSSTQYDYTFKGWSPSIVPVTGNAIYTAVFDSTAISFFECNRFQLLGDAEFFEHDRLQFFRIIEFVRHYVVQLGGCAIQLFGGAEFFERDCIQLLGSSQFLQRRVEFFQF